MHESDAYVYRYYYTRLAIAAVVTHFLVEKQGNSSSSGWMDVHVNARHH
jgi:hypothetical protein